MFHISELRRKDVIDEVDGKKLGFVDDIEIDTDSGKIVSVVVPGESRFLGFFIRNDEIILPWDKIKKIGIDVILIGENTITPVFESNTPLIEKRGNEEWEEWDL